MLENGGGRGRGRAHSLVMLVMRAPEQELIICCSGDSYAVRCCEDGGEGTERGMEKRDGEERWREVCVGRRERTAM